MITETSALLSLAYATTFFKILSFEVGANVILNNTSTNPICLNSALKCHAGETCCPTANATIGCCPYLYANCCKNKMYCCPEGFRCNEDEGNCVSKKQNTETGRYQRLQHIQLLLPELDVSSEQQEELMGDEYDYDEMDEDEHEDDEP